MNAKERLAKDLTNYINEKHNQDKCTGFIDGYNKALEFANSLARERAEKFDDVKKEITRLQEKYDENGYDFSPLIKLLRIESIIDSVINTYANKLDTFLSDKTKEEEK